MKGQLLLRGLRGLYVYAFLAAFTLVLFSYIGLTLSAPLAYQIAGENVTEIPTVRFLGLWVFSLPLTIPLPFPLSFEALFSGLVLLYAAMMALTFVDKETDVLKATRLLRKGDIGGALKNSFFATVTLSAALLVLTLGLMFVQESAGVETGSLQYEDELEYYVGATYAVVREEIGFRSTFVGLIAFLAMTRYVPRGSSLRETSIMVLSAFIYPGWLRRRLRNLIGREVIGSSLLFGIFLSSGVFGAYHFLLGGGWGVGKVSQAFLAGLFFGYIFVEYGLPASIISHSTINYFLSTASLLGVRYSLPILVFELSLLLLGGLTLVYLAGVAKTRLSRSATLSGV